MIQRLKRLARRLLGRTPAKAQGPKRSRVYETAAERDVRLRARNVAYEAEKAKRRVLWESGYRPPLGKAPLPVPENGHGFIEPRPEEIAVSAELNMLGDIERFRARLATNRSRRMQNDDPEGAVRYGAQLEAIDLLLEELRHAGVGREQT